MKISKMTKCFQFGINPDCIKSVVVLEINTPTGPIKQLRIGADPAVLSAIEDLMRQVDGVTVVRSPHGISATTSARGSLQVILAWLGITEADA